MSFALYSWSRHIKHDVLFDRLGIKENHTADFFSHSNEKATQSRDSLAEESLEMLIRWLKEGGGNVGIHGLSCVLGLLVS